MTTAEFRRLHAPQDEADVIAECREVAERCGVVLEEIGQRDARKSGTTLGKGGAGAAGVEIHVHMDGANLYGVPDQATFRKWGAGISQVLGEQLHSALHGSRR